MREARKLIFLSQLSAVLLFAQGVYNDRLLSKPSDPTHVIQGNCVNLTWSYKLKEGDEISKISFGTWGYPTYIKEIIIRVKPNNVIYIRSTYKSRISWIGNYSSSASVRLCNVTRQDKKDYGVEIDIWGRTTLKDGLKLDVDTLHNYTTGRPTQGETNESSFAPYRDTTPQPTQSEASEGSSAQFIILVVIFVMCIIIIMTAAMTYLHKRRVRSTVAFVRI